MAAPEAPKEAPRMQQQATPSRELNFSDDEDDWSKMRNEV